MKRKELILIVDDNIDVLRAISAHLFDLGYENIKIEQDGESALNFYKASIPDIVLLDVKMPKTNGWEVAITLRSSGYSGPIIMLSGEDTAEFGMRAAHVGADDFIPKSALFEALTVRIDRALRNRRRFPGDTKVALFHNSIANLRQIMIENNCSRDALDALDSLSRTDLSSTSFQNGAGNPSPDNLIDFISGSLANTAGNLAAAAILGMLKTLLNS